MILTSVIGRQPLLEDMRVTYMVACGVLGAADMKTLRLTFGVLTLLAVPTAALALPPGAESAEDGTLKTVTLNPGTKGHDAAIASTDHRLNGEPPIFNVEGKIVFQPQNTPVVADGTQAKLSGRPVRDAKRP